MILLLRHFIGWMVGVFGSREDLILENLVSPVLLRWRLVISEVGGYCSFAYSALAAFRMGMSGSAFRRSASLRTGCGSQFS